MGNPVIKSLKRRRLQRWLRKEALELAHEARMFGCPHMLREANALLKAAV
jgi:hypothetical protein